MASSFGTEMPSHPEAHSRLFRFHAPNVSGPSRKSASNSGAISSKKGAEPYAVITARHSLEESDPGASATSSCGRGTPPRRSTGMVRVWTPLDAMSTRRFRKERF